MSKFKKGSPEAKAFMAKLRRMKKSATKKAAPKKKAVTAKKKAAPKRKTATKKASTHKDTKSHNVNIRVVSGIGAIKTDLSRKLTAAQNNLAELVGKLASTKEIARLTKSKTAKSQLPVIRKKITEAKKIVLVLKKAAK